MIRGLNSIYTQAHIPQTDAEKRSFAGYALCWCEFTHHHHAGVFQVSRDSSNKLGRKILFPCLREECSGINGRECRTT